MIESPNRRILLVDDTPSIHEDFKKILVKSDDKCAAVDDAMAGLLGAAEPAEAPAGGDEPALEFHLESALQGADAAELVKSACAAGAPFALAFVDIRMPPGWDGVRTIEAIWRLDSEIQTVICTAYSDYSWDQMIERLGRSDRLLVLKKPFDPVEITQLALALTEKWNITRRKTLLVEELKKAEAEARSYAASLETVNHALVTAKAATDKLTEMKSEFLLRLSDAVSENVENILGKALELKNGSEELAAYNSIDTIISTSQRLMSTFHEALDVARVETGRGDVRVEAVDPLALLREVVAEESAVARKRGLDIRLDAPVDLSASIEVNPRQARQVLAEFVRVAVHSTASGVLGVACATELTDDWRRPRLRVEVTGIGRGIRGEDRARIFDLFGSGNFSGTGKATRQEDVAPGLGIALAKRIADVLGWEIDLARDADGAPVFVVAFDVRVAGSPAPRA